MTERLEQYLKGPISKLITDSWKTKGFFAPAVTIIFLDREPPVKRTCKVLVMDNLGASFLLDPVTIQRQAGNVERHSWEKIRGPTLDLAEE